MPKFVLIDAEAGFTGSVSDTDSNGQVHSIHFDNGVSRYVTDQDKIWVAHGMDCLELPDHLDEVDISVVDAVAVEESEERLLTAQLVEAVVYQRGRNGLVDFLNRIGLPEFSEEPVCVLIDVCKHCTPLWLEANPVKVSLVDQNALTGVCMFNGHEIRFTQGHSDQPITQAEIRFLSRHYKLKKET